jgi:hypothetical protein
MTRADEVRARCTAARTRLGVSFDVQRRKGRVRVAGGGGRGWGVASDTRSDKKGAGRRSGPQCHRGEGLQLLASMSPPLCLAS